MDNKKSRFICTSIKGANHADKGLPCQDAAATATLYHKGYKFFFMAVADGHGGDAYTRSDVGSFLALQAASESVNRFIIFVIDTFEKFPNNWIEMVKDDFQGRFGKMLVNNWVRMVEAHANDTENNPDDVIKLYGTTISIGLVFNNCFFSGKIGDGSIYSISYQDKKFLVNNLFETDDKNSENLGLATASLCSRDAYKKWQMQVLFLEDIKMLFLVTDGFTDSLKDPKKEILNYYFNLIKKGFTNFEFTIAQEIKQLSQKGVGDDISLVIFLPNLQGKV
ncbi:MAG: protein phosphatase 2C domain-containing protein [Treponema sp.]|nr:protein phosphatase 2C domain-containing protein [Treponema sp.]